MGLDTVQILPPPAGLGARYDFEDKEVHDERDRNGEDDGTQEGGPKDVQGFPGQKMLVIEMLGMKFRRELVGPAEDQKAHLELPPQDHRPDGQEDIVKGDRQDGRELAATEEPGNKDGQQGLKSEKRGESKDDTNGDASGDGVRSIANLHEPLLAAVILEGEVLAEAAHLKSNKMEN